MAPPRKVWAPETEEQKAKRAAKDRERYLKRTLADYWKTWRLTNCLTQG